MYPILLKIGFLQIYSYGFMMAAAFAVSVFLILKEGKKDGLEENFLIDFIFYVVLSGVVGARLFYVLIDPIPYINHPISIFKVWEGGMVFYGGVIFAVPVGIFLLKKNVSILKISDLFSSVMPLAHAIGRIGCFLAGCCYGRKTASIFGVVFNDPHSLAPVGVKLHPAQLYDMAVNFLIFFFLINFKKRKKFDGEITALYLVLYPSFRFLLEYFRGDERGELGLLSATQFMSLILAMTGVLIFFYARRKNQNQN